MGRRVLTVLGAHVADARPAAAAEPEPVTVDVFWDYSSADAYLGLDAVQQLEHDYHVVLNWVPFRIREPEFGLCGPDGEPDVSDARPHWQRKHPQLWREAQEYAALRGLELRGMAALPDTATALLGMLYVAEHSPHSLAAYHAFVFEAIWGGGQQDLADQRVIESFVTASGCVGPFHTEGFRAFVAKGQAEGLLDRIEADAKDSPGVFGVPTLHFEGGGAARKPVERLFVKEIALSLLRHELESQGLARAGRGADPDVPFARRTLEAVAGPPQRQEKVIDVYVDLKSPYAYLAIAPTAALERDFNVRIDWLPYTLDIPSYLGSARVGKKDNKVKAGSANRSPAQWNAVRYAYMDARRYATRRTPELTIFGTEKIWDSSLAGMAMLWVRRLAADAPTAEDRAALWTQFNDALWPPFWRRELDIEDPAVLRDVLDRAGLQSGGFEAFCDDGGEGRAEYAAVQLRAVEERGVFGVPTFCFDDARGGGACAYWGREHLNLIRLRLYEEGFARPGAAIDAPHVWTGR